MGPIGSSGVRGPSSYFNKNGGPMGSSGGGSKLPNVSSKGAGMPGYSGIQKSSAGANRDKQPPGFQPYKYGGIGGGIGGGMGSMSSMGGIGGGIGGNDPYQLNKKLPNYQENSQGV